jgi:outer membrane receptor protein involved in Fe transport
MTDTPTYRTIQHMRSAILGSAALLGLMAQPAVAQDAEASAVTQAAGQNSASTGTIGSEPAAAGEIIVTATRRAESILRVPLSVTSYSPEVMDRQGIRQIDDIARLTPSLRFARTSGTTGNNGTNISIRGIASDVGAATTAIYIDDTPIQIRSVGYFSGNPYPRVFDLERVEVLRGPQGTLFGAGAEGGAVRFLTPQPNFDDFDIYSRAEVSTTKHGEESFEGGLAAGGAVSDTLAVRFSGWYRRDGGYIDRIVPQTTRRTEKDINSQDTYASKLAVSWRPVEEFTLTPSIYYQKIESDGRDQFWEGNGNPGKQDYVNGATNREPSTDRFYIPSLKATYDFGRISLISNGSYFNRRQAQILDYTNYLSFLRSGSPFGNYTNKLATNAFVDLTNAQRNFTQEVRLQSFNDDSFIDWTAGAYYSKTKQRFTYFSASGLIPGVISRGFPQYLGRYNLFERINADDTQVAGFASVDVKPITDVKISLGGRYTRNKFDFLNFRTGPVNSGVSTTVNFSQKEDSFTPRIAASWQVDPGNLLYASASKGFRQGGAQPIVDRVFCATDVAALGVVDSAKDYKSDSVWAYEAGSKNKLFGGAVILDTNAYVIKWKNIQQAIRLPTCGFTFIGNLGEATAKGVDISFQLTPVKGLQLGANVGYNKSTFDDDVFFDGNTSDSNPGVIVRKKGQRLGGPSWTGSVFAQFDQPVSAGTEAYARFDYSFANRGIAIPNGVFGFDPGLPALEGADYSTVRAGVRFSGVDLSLFVNNLTNQDKPLSRNHDGIGSPLYYVQTYRPRTIGLTGQFRY